jgi:hypothetical protein
MKNSTFFVYDNYERDELKLADFFPVPLRTRLKKSVQKSFWPFVIAALVATAVALTVAVVTGGLSVPGTGLIAAYQGLFFPIVKKVVIAIMAAASFFSTFFLSKWVIARKEAKKAEEFSNHMNAEYEDSHVDLPEYLKTSNVKEIYITGYHKQENTVSVGDYSDPAHEYISEVVYPKEECFVPLAEPRLLNAGGDKVTHYREKDDFFRVYKADGTEVDLDRAQMLALRAPKETAPTKASLFLSRPPTMKPLPKHLDDSELDRESRNGSPSSVNISPSSKK